jgi:hypothetical protein
MRQNYRFIHSNVVLEIADILRCLFQGTGFSGDPLLPVNQDT